MAERKTATVTIALDLAAAGLPVFPCARTKKPAVAKAAGGHGFLDATTAPDAIRELFNRANAVLVGVPTGAASGFDVLDLDFRHGAAAWEQANAHRLPETRTHETQSGGRHLLFQHAPGVRNSEGRVADGVDVRGEGGYIIHPPSPGYRVISDAPITPWPDWLLPLVVPPPRPAAAPRQSGPRVPLSDERLQAITEAALERVRRAADGQKHYQLRAMARLLGGIAAMAGFSDTEAIRWLLDALPDSVQDKKNAAKTAEWGLKNGRAAPITVEDTPPPEPTPPPPPDPRRQATARAAFQLLRMGLRNQQLLAVLHEQNCKRSDPLPASVVGKTAIWAAQQHAERTHATRR